jgi:hypothetical protein
MGRARSRAARVQRRVAERPNCHSQAAIDFRSAPSPTTRSPVNRRTSATTERVTDGLNRPTKLNLRVVIILAVATGAMAIAGCMKGRLMDLLFVPGFVVLLVVAARSGLRDLPVMGAVIASSNSAYWLAFALWSAFGTLGLHDERDDTSSFAGIVALWLLGFLVLCVYEILVLVKSLRQTERPKLVVYAGAFVMQALVTYKSIWELLAGI